MRKSSREDVCLCRDVEKSWFVKCVCVRPCLQEVKPLATSRQKTFWLRVRLSLGALVSAMSDYSLACTRLSCRQELRAESPVGPPQQPGGLLSWLQVLPACLHLSTSHHRADGGPLTRLREGDKESTHFRCISDKGKRRGSA